MSGLFSSLYTRLTAAFAGLVFLLGMAFLQLTNWSNNRYYEEVTQKINKSLAMYIAQREPLIENQKVNIDAIKELADLVMVVNPIVEVYLLDVSGKILAHSLPEKTIVHPQIDIKPIKKWLAGDQTQAVTGQDPRSSNAQRVFSAYPIEDQRQIVGYLYVVLGGQDYQSLSNSLRSSYALKQNFAGIFALLIFTTICAAIIFSALTRPLRRLSRRMDDFQKHQLQAPLSPIESIDEIQRLTQAFDAMALRIMDQLKQLENTDSLRRELISSVSHDLRTPLSSMQGYLEVLLKPDISASERAHYAAIAFKHCQRLTQLVKELFELSKLESGRIQPQKEDFSLAELLQDVAQKFALKAQEHKIELQTPKQTSAFMVHADISLIERVLENLIDNALRYTANGGSVKLHLCQLSDKVEVQIADTGIGLAEEDIPYIFERYYCAAKPDEYKQNSTGLGLAIVKRILDLHGSNITVTSQLHQGSTFSFPLQIPN